jgi:hypothetical protein
LGVDVVGASDRRRLHFQPFRLMLRLASRVLATMLVVVVGLSCSESPTRPGRVHVRLALVPQFSAKALEIYRSLGAFAVTLDNVHVVVRSQATGDQLGPILKDTTVAFPATADQITIAIELVIQSDQQEVTATVELREGTTALFSGTQPFLAKQGETVTSATPVVMQYVGPGASATFIIISPQPTTLALTTSFQYTARALDALERTVTDLPLTWSIDDASIATVSQTGLVTTTGKLGLATLTAKGLNGAIGHASVNVQPVARLAITAGENQTGVAGVALPTTWQVQAFDATGNAVIGATINFAAPGGGTVSPGTATTDVNGIAKTTLTLGQTIGTYAFTATVAGTSSVTTRVTAAATAAAAAALGIISGNNQADTVLATLAQALVVKVTDAFGNGVPQQPVDFVVATGQGGLLTPGIQQQPLVHMTTDNNGIAQVSLVNGIIAGALTVRASAPQTAIAPVTFAATVKAGLPNKLLMLQQPSATALATIPLGVQPKVQVTDQFSNPVALAGLSVFADAFLDCTKTGCNQLIAPASTRPSLSRSGSGTISARTIARSARRLTAPSSQMTRLAVPTMISATRSVSDTFPRGLGGKSQVTTDASGVATFTDLSIDEPVGPWFLQFFDAKESLAPAITTTINLSAGPPESIIAWGVTDTTFVFATLDTLSPSVRVIDKVGNGVPGVPVTWSIPDNLSKLDSATTKTDVAGVAAAGLWVFGFAAGQRFVIQATPTPSKLENSPLSLYALISLIGRVLPPKTPSTPR